MRGTGVWWILTWAIIEVFDNFTASLQFFSERQEAVSNACQQLKNNKVVAVPTDTIYGITGLAQSTEAVNRIYDIKGRASCKPVSICVGDVNNVARYHKIL